MAFSYPEWEDLVQEYLVSLYKRFGRPIPPLVLAASMSKDVGEVVDIKLVRDALESLEEKELIKKAGKGYVPLAREVAFRVQLDLPEVEPFTREPGEVIEAHMDKVWLGDIRQLQKPTFGNEYGLYPVVQYSAEDKVWRGLTKED